MKDNEIIDRIKYMCSARSWTYYKLAKESGIAYSTLCTMLHKSNAPSLPTLYKICSGFGISLGEFFDNDTDKLTITPDEKTLLKNWRLLSMNDQIMVQKFISYLLTE